MSDHRYERPLRGDSVSKLLEAVAAVPDGASTAEAWWTWRHAAWELGHRREPAAVPYALRALRADDVDIQMDAATLLAEIGDTSVLPELETRRERAPVPLDAALDRAIETLRIAAAPTDTEP